MSSFLLTDVRIFDGQDSIDSGSVLVEDGKITQVCSGTISWQGTTYSKPGHTVLPGLIDCHVHCDSGNTTALPQSLRFGVTTELEMQGAHTRLRRDDITEDDTVADVRSSGFGLTPPGGHPAELFPEGFRPGPPPGAPAPAGPRPVQATVSTPEEAAAVVPRSAA